MVRQISAIALSSDKQKCLNSKSGDDYVFANRTDEFNNRTRHPGDCHHIGLLE